MRENIPFLRELGDELCGRLIPLLRPVSLKADGILFRQNDNVTGCYAIEHGTLIVSIQDHAGEEAWLSILGSGDLVGEIGIIDREPRSATVTALRDTKMWHLPSGDFDHLCQQDFELYRRVAKLIAHRLRAANQQVCDQRLGLEGRLALTLNKLADAFGEELDDGRVLIRYKISQARLAEVTGASRENVNRHLRAWSDNKVISRVSNYYCLSKYEVWHRHCHDMEL
jgi:CRP-like cAMP-binding protein